MDGEWTDGFWGCPRIVDFIADKDVNGVRKEGEEVQENV